MEIIAGSSLIFALIVLANWAETQAGRSLKQALHWLFVLFNVPVFLLGVFFLLMPASFWEEAGLVGFTDFRPAGVIFLILSILAIVVTLPDVRQQLAQFTDIKPDSAVHTLALILVIYLVGQNAITLSQGGLEALADSATSVSIVEVIATQSMFLIAALLGVGLLTRRGPLKLIERLDLAWPTRKQWLEAAWWVFVLVVLQAIAGAAWFALAPEQAELLENVSGELLGDIDTVGEWFALAVAAGVGEEILFRGALQPVLGLGATSLIFAFAHVQYGLSPATLFIFVLGFILGLVRRRTNTTTVILVHFGYDFVLGLMVLAAPLLESLVQ